MNLLVTYGLQDSVYLSLVASVPIMSSMKIALLAVVAFAAPMAVTIAYHLKPNFSAAESEGQPLVGKVLFFSSPG